MTTIAIACSGLGHIHRGNENWARTIAEALHADGESVHLYGGGAQANLRCPFTRVWNLRRDWWGWSGRMAWGRRYAYEQQTFARALLFRLSRDLPEIVHTADPILAYRLGLSASGGKFQLVYKDGLLLGPDYCRRFEWVQVLSPYYLDEASKAGIQTKRWFVIPHVVDTTCYAPSDDMDSARRMVIGSEVPGGSFIVLAVGDFAQESNKRLDWIVSEVVSLGPDSGVHVMLAGQASQQDILRVTQMCLPLRERAHLFPNTPQEMMPDLFRAADVFTHAALREPFGIVFLEAMASGLPTVGNTFPTTQWIIGEGGKTVDMTRPGELANVLRDWHREPNLRREIGAAARERAVSKFTTEKIVPLYRELYAAMRSG